MSLPTSFSDDRDSVPLTKCCAPDVIENVSCRHNFWFWDSVVLVQTLALAAAQVFTTTLDTFFQLTVMLMILFIGSVALPHFHPFEDKQSQPLQVPFVG